MVDVFKFGGASIRDPESIRNMAEIVRKYSDSSLIIITSAMGKTTNHLEQVLKSFIDNGDWQGELNEVLEYHIKIADSLFAKEDPIFTKIELLVSELSSYLESNDNKFEIQLYSHVVAYGELLSTLIVSSFLNEQIHPVALLDARTFVATDDNFIDAHIDWEKTQGNIQEIFPNHLKNGHVLTQGFIGSNENSITTTLGREGSDFSAAIISKCIGANSMTVWKDVDGVFNADPKLEKEAVVIPELSYREAAEMTFYGAKVIHPKTIRPLAEAGIPLKVKPFNAPEKTGTVISADGPESYPAIKITKKNQSLISFKVEDLSFIDEGKISTIYEALHGLNIKVNLLENSANSFSICVDTKFDLVDRLISKLSGDFKIAYNQGLELFTIKNFGSNDIGKLNISGEILLEQRSRNAIHILYTV